MPRRTKEEALETRNRLLDAAERVFSVRGVAHTSLADIAAAAEVTRGAIYWHFKNKCELFTAMMDRELLPLDELLGTPPTDPDPLGRLREILIACLSDIGRNPRRRTVVEILILKWEHTPDMQPVIDRKKRNVRQSVLSLRRALDHAIEKKQLPATVDTQRASGYLHGLIVGVITDYFTIEGGFDIEREAPWLIDSYIEMLRSAPSMQQVRP